MSKTFIAYIIAFLTLVSLTLAFFVYEERIKTPEIRPAAYCQPYDEYERYETKTVYSIDDVPADCKSLFICSGKYEDHEMHIGTEEQLYGKYIYNSFLWSKDDIEFTDNEFYEYRLVCPGTADDIIDKVTALAGLERLAIYCMHLSGLEKLSHMEDLRSLYIDDGDSDKKLNLNFNGTFPALTDLTLIHCGITNIGSIKNISTLKRLNLPFNKISSLKGIEKLTGLSALNVSANELTELYQLRTMTQLTILCASYQYGGYSVMPLDLSALRCLTNLEMLDISQNEIKDLSPAANLKSLNMLNAAENNISDISALSGLTDLEHLEIRINRISDISPLAGLEELEYLNIYNNDVKDISAVSELSNLEYLTVGYNKLTDISPVSSLFNLKELSIHNTNVSDISAVIELPHLEILNIGYSNVSDISALAAVRTLRELHMKHCTRLSDLSPLFDLPDLEKVYVDKWEQISEDSQVILKDKIIVS